MAPRASRHPADRSARVSTAQGASIRDDARSSRRPPPRPATLGRARTAAPSQPRTVRVENSRIAIRRGIRAAPKRNDHPRVLRVHAKMKKTDTSLEKKKRFPTDASSNDASRYRRLTATLLPPRASRLPSAFFIPDDDARRTPEDPGSTRRARAKSSRPTRMTTENPETVWRRFKPLDARRSRSRNRKPTASTRASAISTSRSMRGHRCLRAS